MTSDTEGALSCLAKSYRKVLLSSGAETEARLEALIKSKLKGSPEALIASALKEHELIKRHTHTEMPTEPGMYLRLSHGRESIDAELEDWGYDGPWVGPIDWFHCTYMYDIGIGFATGEEFGPAAGTDLVPPPIFFSNDMIYCDGSYYGNWEVLQLRPLHRSGADA